MYDNASLVFYVFGRALIPGIAILLIAGIMRRKRRRAVGALEPPRFRMGETALMLFSCLVLFASVLGFVLDTQTLGRRPEDIVEKLELVGSQARSWNYPSGGKIEIGIPEYKETTSAGREFVANVKGTYITLCGSVDEKTGYVKECWLQMDVPSGAERTSTLWDSGYAFPIIVIGLVLSLSPDVDTFEKNIEEFKQIGPRISAGGAEQCRIDLTWFMRAEIDIRSDGEIFSGSMHVYPRFLFGK